MAKIIAVLNHKGGVGKTTTTINLAAALQQKKKRVLLIDMDGQANLTESCGLSIEEERTVYGAMKGEYTLPVFELENGLSVVPSCLDLSATESELINEPGRELILKGLIAKLLETRKFDYILIDCPPSLGIVTTNAFIAADEIIVPMTPELLPLKGMRMLDAFVTTLQRVKPSLRLGGVFIARFNHRKLNKVVEQAVKERYESITMNTRIRENIALAESAGSGKSIFEYDLNSNGAKDYLALTEEILSRNQ